MDKDNAYCSDCGREGAWDVFNPFCPACGSPLFLRLKERPRSFRERSRSSLERYADYLPLPSVEPSLGLGEGGTPLVRLDRLGKDLGLNVLAKNETQNPTWSFKDRGTAVAVRKAVSLGLRRIGTVSTGNMAASTAAYGARAGLETIVLVKEDTGSEKIISTAVHRPALLAVRGEYGALFRKSYELGRRHGVYFMNSVDPLRIEGYKLEAFEVFEQLECRLPDIVVLPVSAGGHFLGLAKGFLELKEEGKAPGLPRLTGIQAEGCAPLASAFAGNELSFKPFPAPRTIAHAISNPDPPGGKAVLKFAREFGGAVLSVSDEEMLEAQRLLAEREGLFCLPDSAAALAGLFKMKDRKLLEAGETAVLILTGTGLKNLQHIGGAAAQAADLVDIDRLDDFLSVLLRSD